MCQMCEEYEAEPIRMGLVAEARQHRAERHDAPKQSAPPAPAHQTPPDADHACREDA